MRRNVEDDVDENEVDEDDVDEECPKVSVWNA